MIQGCGLYTCNDYGSHGKENMATPWYLREILHAWKCILYNTDGSLLKTEYDYGVCMQEILYCVIIGIKLVVTVLEYKVSSNL